MRFTVLMALALAGCAPGATRVPPRAPETAVRLVATPAQEGRVVVTLRTARGALSLIDVREPTRSSIIVARGGARHELRWDDSTPIWSWQAAQVASDGSTVIAVVDSAVEAPARELEVLVSPDGGGRWFRRTAIEKPHYLATFQSLELRGPDRYRVTVRLDDCADCGHAPGLYTYETSDGARTWSSLAP